MNPKSKILKCNWKSPEKQAKQSCPNMPNVDKSQHLNKLQNSKLKHIVLIQHCKYLKGFIHYQNEVYVTYEK